MISTENIIVLSAFAAYLIIMIIIGFVCSKGTKNNEDYFLGGRNLGGWTAALSAQASDMSGWLLMGLPGSIYLAGTGEIWIAIGLLIGTILNWYIVSARLRKYTIVAGNSLTIPSFFQNRYRDKKGIIKIVSAVIIAIFFTVYTASAFSSGAKLFATLFSDGNTDSGNYNTVYIVGLCIAALVILIYTFMGGFKAVCVTDFVQGMLMLVAIMSVPVLAYATLTYNTAFSDAIVANGVSNPEDYLNFMKNSDGSPVSAVSIISNLAWGLGYFGMPHILIRFMAVKSNSEIKKSRKIAITWVVISLAASCLIGLVARGYLNTTLDGAESETVFIRTIQQLFSGNGILIFIGGIFLCGILAAIMSTADSQLLVTASSVSEDIYLGINKNATEKKALWVGKIAVVIVAIVAFFIALDPSSSIMSLVSDAWAGFGSAFGPLVLLALFWKRSTLAGAISGMATGALTVIIWDYLPIVNGTTLYNATGLYSLVLGFALALVVNVVVSLLTKKPSKEIIDEFESIKTIEI